MKHVDNILTMICADFELKAKLEDARAPSEATRALSQNGYDTKMISDNVFLCVLICFSINISVKKRLMHISINSTDLDPPPP